MKVEKGTLSVSSGTPTISGDLVEVWSNVTIDVTTGQTLNYTGASPQIPTGLGLTLTGGGTFNNTNALVLHDAESKLLLNSITVDSVSTSADSS